MKVYKFKNGYLFYGLFECEKFEEDKLIEIFKKFDFCQIIRFDIVISEFHVLHAILQSIIAMKNKKMITKSFQMELLIRMYGKRQISDAIRELSPKDNKICIYGFSKDLLSIKNLFKHINKELKIKKYLTFKPNEKELIKVYGSSNEKYIISKISCLGLEK